jgi:hypothetical protein
MVIGLSFSRAFASLSYVLIIATWLFDRNVFRKFEAFFKNRAAWMLASIYFIHLIGLVYTSDFSYAWLEIRTKIPLLILPLVFSTMRKISKKEFLLVLLIFSLSVVATWGTSLFYFLRDAPLDFRDAFHFNSHIRLSLMAIIAVGIFGWMSFNPELRIPLWAKFIFILMSIFLIWVVTIMEVMSGMIILLLASIILGFIFAYRSNYPRGKIALGVIITLFLLAAAWLYVSIDNYRTPDESVIKKQYSKQGNIYFQDESLPIENGSYIGRNICWSEMKSAWKDRSSIPFDSSTSNGYAVNYTLLRYLNSKHLSKDKEGVAQLSEQDVKAIENGFANVEYTKQFSFKKRIYKLLWEYDNFLQGGDINSSSAIKRFLLWKTGLNIIAQNPIIGVGTGDVKQAFKNQLHLENSPLKDSNLRAHNQWISIAIAFGLVGFLLFTFALFYPWIYLKRFDFLFVSFFVIYTLSMFWEDSLETQIGVTIFAFFYPFLLFLNPYSKNK